MGGFKNRNTLKIVDLLWLNKRIRIVIRQIPDTDIPTNTSDRKSLTFKIQFLIKGWLTRPSTFKID